MSDVRILPVSPKIETAHARKHAKTARAWCPLCQPAETAQTAPKASVARDVLAHKPVQAHVAQAPEVAIPAQVRDAAAVLAGFARKYDVRLTHVMVTTLAQAQTVGVPTPAPTKPARKPDTNVPVGAPLSKNGYPLKGAALAKHLARVQAQDPTHVWVQDIPVAA